MNAMEHLKVRQEKLARHAKRRKLAQKKNKLVNWLYALGIRKEWREKRAQENEEIKLKKTVKKQLDEKTLEQQKVMGLR